MAIKLGDWHIGPTSRIPDSDKINLADVASAFEWILGTPQKPASLEKWLRDTGESRRVLRLRLLRSPAFGHFLDQLCVAPRSAIVQAASDPNPSKKHTPEKIIYIHIPKTAGTSVHYHLTENFEQGEISQHRHNDILTTPALSLMRPKLFSGHYDWRITEILPGANPTVFTVLREPTARLVSLYRYLASHRPSRIWANDFALARAARQHDFNGFLEAAIEINPGAVDNVYVRTFGSTLPLARWEAAAEPEWMERFGSLSAEDWRGAMAAAMSRLEDLDFVGSVENIDESMKQIARLLNFTPPARIEHLKVMDAVTDETTAFEPVGTFKPETSPILERLTQFDNQLYRRFCLPATGAEEAAAQK